MQTTLKALQHEIDLAALPYRARLLFKQGYAFSTIAKLLDVKVEQIKDWCQGVWLHPKYRPRMQTYAKSPKHRKSRFNTYHRDTHLTKKERSVA